MHALWNLFATIPFMLEGNFWEYTSYVLIVLMTILCLTFIVKALEYGKKYANLELKSNEFEEEATNSGH